MEKYSGKVAFEGVAIGKIVEIIKHDSTVKRERIEDKELEKQRFGEARAKALGELAELYEQALEQVGEENAMIFEAHQMMLEDLDYVESIEGIIENEGVNAEYAVATTGDAFAKIFAEMDDEYMQARATDVRDISDRVVMILSNRANTSTVLTEPSIIVADDLTPSETVQMDKSKVIAFVTRGGSTNSHTSILARTLAIPAIVDAHVGYDLDGKPGIVSKNEFIVEPDEVSLKQAEELRAEYAKKRELLEAYRGVKTQTKSGKSVKLYANVGGIFDIETAIANDSGGVGLLRSEFIYLEHSDFPDEETQFAIYKQAAQLLGEKKLIIRTLDVGADKQIDYFDLDVEENPALGYRAVRICLTRRKIFKTQLRALLRAGMYGNVSIMVPMIASLWELQDTKVILQEVKDELKAEGIAYKDPEFGIMIETPSAVMIAEDLAKEVDFFSIGTNDLTQYTLAVDRQNPKLEKFYDPRHPAVLKMIKMTVEAGHKEGIWVGICGEMAADTGLTETFLNYGVDELSVSPAMTLQVRKAICELD